MGTEKTIADMLIGTLQLNERGLSFQHGRPAYYRDNPDVAKAAGLMCIARRRVVEASVDAGEDFRDLLDAASTHLTLDERRDGVFEREARWTFEDGSEIWEEYGWFTTDPPGRVQDPSGTWEADLTVCAVVERTGVDGMDRLLVAKVDGQFVTKDEAAARCAVLAAAKDMKAALEGMVEQFERESPDDIPEYTEPSSNYRKARAALEKARRPNAKVPL